MNSAERAKERVQKTIAESLEPYGEVLSDADRICDLERQLDRLKMELENTKMVLRATEASNADWRFQYVQSTSKLMCAAEADK